VIAGAAEFEGDTAKASVAVAIKARRKRADRRVELRRLTGIFI
jgi:hypothetical protein